VDFVPDDFWENNPQGVHTSPFRRVTINHCQTRSQTSAEFKGRTGPRACPPNKKDHPPFSCV